MGEVRGGRIVFGEVLVVAVVLVVLEPKSVVLFTRD